jgi:hypothetical protein
MILGLLLTKSLVRFVLCLASTFLSPRLATPLPSCAMGLRSVRRSSTISGQRAGEAPTDPPAGATTSQLLERFFSTLISDR